MFHRIFSFLIHFYFQRRVKWYNRHIIGEINFVRQGFGGIEIDGPLDKFQIGLGGSLKSGTYLECKGGIKIGNYVHCGRNITILSTNHKFSMIVFERKQPFDFGCVEKLVTIGDYVWIGAKVTILPGASIGAGDISGAGMVVVDDVPPERTLTYSGLIRELLNEQKQSAVIVLC